MRHLLFLAHRIPFPPDKGDKIRSFHILQHLSSRFKIHLGCFFDDAVDEMHIADLRRECAEVNCLPLGPLKKIVRGVNGIVVGKSISEASYSDARMSAWVRATLKRYDINDIFVFCSTMAPYVLDAGSKRHLVIDVVDVDSAKWELYARSAFWPLSALYRMEHRRVFELEIRAITSSDSALFVSKTEAQEILDRAPELHSRVGYMENGVDLKRFDPALIFPIPFDDAKPCVVFTGAMSYWPNVDAVTWFAREIFPAVRREHPLAEFWVVGANPTAQVRRLSKLPGVRVTGSVFDVRPYLAHATCVVAPLRVARGVQNKVLEGMAFAKPVVLTSAALEGLHACPGRDVLLADSKEDFGRRVSEQLSDRLNEFGSAARTYVETYHRWSENLKVLNELFPQDT